MIIAMFNGWYFLWLLLAAGATLGLYFLLRNASSGLQKGVLFGLLLFGLLLHFLKAYIPPYSVDEARLLRDAWFVNICGANIALFPFFFLSKNKYVKDYMFYIGVISGLIALFYPQEPIAKLDQLAEFWDIVRFYFHHWMLLTVPLLMVLLGHHQLSWKRILSAPVGLLLVMGLFAKMAPMMGGKDGDKKGGGFDLSAMGGMMDMLGGFTFLRLAGMIGTMGIKFTKEELLDINAKLNKIKAPKK